MENIQALTTIVESNHIDLAIAGWLVVLQKGRCCGKLGFYSRTPEEFLS